MSRQKVKQPRKPYAMRWLPHELEQARSEAKKAGITLSAYIRKRTLGLRVMSRMDDRTLNQLNSHMGLAKHIAFEKPEHAPPMFKVCKHIHDAIRLIEAVYRRELHMLDATSDTAESDEVQAQEANHARASVGGA